jgi:hypothetical protein
MERIMPLAKTRDFAVAAFVGVSLLMSAAGAHAEDDKGRQPYVTVSGEGESSIAPDMAIMTLSVVKQSKTAADALDQNNKAMGAVLATLKESGVADRDLQTSGFSVQPQYNYDSRNNQPPKLTGYQVTNGLTVKVRDLSKLGALLDQSVNLGINQGGDIQFTNDKPDAILQDARKNAVADAAAKAKTLTEAAGVKLGRVLSIREGGGAPPPQPFMRMEAAPAAAPKAVPIAAGENSYHASVSITYAIEQ